MHTHSLNPLLRAAALLMALALLCAAIPAAADDEDTSFSETKSLLLRLLEQENTDALLLDELNSGAYTPADPLVVVNPYDLSPLTALILFQTETPCQIAIHVPGKDAQTALDFAFDGSDTDHIIPVYGLYAGTKNMVELTLTPEDGGAYTVTVPVETEQLSARYDFLHIITAMEQPEKYEPGVNISYESVLYLGGVAAFDSGGEPRWHLALPEVQFYTQNYDYNGHFLLGVDYGWEQRYLFEVDPLGRIYQVTALYNSSFHHDVEVYGENSVLIPYSSVNQPTIEDMIVEIDLDTGEIVNTMDLRDVLQSTRGISNASNDPFHLNAIVAIEGSTDILLSLRAQDYILRMSWPDGEIKWIAGSDENSLPMFDKYYLTETARISRPSTASTRPVSSRRRI